MLTALSISNFKCFGQAQSVRLAPITLLYGANSAGKSSLAQALLALQQSSESRAGAAGREFVPRGPLVDLGSFQSAVHGHDVGNTLKIGLETPTSGMSFGYRWHGDSRTAPLSSMAFHHSTRQLALSTEGPASQGTPILETAASERLRFPLDDEAAVIPTTGEGEGILGEVTTLLFDRHGAYPGLLREVQRRDGSIWTIDDHVRELVKSKPTVAENYLAHASETDLIDEIITGLRDEIQRELSLIRYLGPWRQAPARITTSAQQTGNGVGRAGEAVVDLLAGDERLIASLNEWFDVLEIPYEARVERISTEATSKAIGDANVLLLTDRRYGVTVSPADVGFGLSQVIPVIVETVLDTTGLLCVEQPELHLHPQLQARLGDLFAHRALNGSGRQFLLETHSEHLLLRLQRLIRRGELAPSDVAVHFVRPTSRDESEVRELRLSDSAEFLDEWPGGFFEERFDEVFGS